MLMLIGKRSFQNKKVGRDECSVLAVIDCRSDISHEAPCFASSTECAFLKTCNLTVPCLANQYIHIFLSLKYVC